MIRRVGAGAAVVAAALVLATTHGFAQGQRGRGPRWFKTNLHSHTINSDGDSTPYDLFAWYRRNGWNVLVITDHNILTDTAPMQANGELGALVIQGEEITNEKNVHVNGIGVHTFVPPATGTITEILQTCIDRIRAAGGIPLINHPNWKFTIGVKDLLPLKNTGLLEIMSGYNLMNEYGDGRDVPSMEEAWDQLLTSGVRFWAVAVDDTHNLRQEFLPNRGNPGQAWVWVRAEALTEQAILSALSSGDFYASTGVELTELTATASSLTVGVKDNPDTRQRVVFIGKGGRVLQTSFDKPARYNFKGDEGYVRARVEDSGGWRAWTQPVFLK